MGGPIGCRAIRLRRRLPGRCLPAACASR
jgi:hypothetical protein